jgi:rhamnosyltransferase
MILNNKSIRALIVCFHPDEYKLVELVKILSNQVTDIYILNNGGISEYLLSKLRSFKNTIIHTFKDNVGIGLALNYGFKSAINDCINFIVTFDQDSSPSVSHAPDLLNKWIELSKKTNNRIAALGPSLIDVRGIQYSLPFFRTDGLLLKRIYEIDGANEVSVDLLITSGMFIPVHVWEQGFHFNEEIFIDFVDTEWCFRVRSAGFLIFGVFDVKMDHCLSDGETIKFLGLRLLKYSPIRRYYYFRNALYLISCSYTPWAYKIKFSFGLVLRVLTMPFIDEHPRSSLIFMLKGLRDGFTYKFGKFN